MTATDDRRSGGKRTGGTRAAGLRRALAVLGLAAVVLTPVGGCASQARRAGSTTVRVEQGGSNGSGPAARNGAGSGANQGCPYAKWLASQTAAPAPTSTDNATPGNTPKADELAQALGTQGRRAAYASVYATLIVDFPPGRVALCVTDVAQGRAMARAAKAADPRIELDRIDYYVSRYSKATLDQATDKLVQHMDAHGALAGVPVYGLGPAQDCNGMQITTSPAGTKSAALRAELARLLGGLPFMLVAGTPSVPAVAVGNAPGK